MNKVRNDPGFRGCLDRLDPVSEVCSPGGNLGKVSETTLKFRGFPVDRFGSRSEVGRVGVGGRGRASFRSKFICSDCCVRWSMIPPLSLHVFTAWSPSFATRVGWISREVPTARSPHILCHARRTDQPRTLPESSIWAKLCSIAQLSQQKIPPCLQVGILRMTWSVSTGAKMRSSTASTWPPCLR